MVIHLSNFDLYSKLAEWNRKDTADNVENLSPTSFANLRRTHACYDPITLTKQRLLYLGGDAATKNADLFCSRFGWEVTDDAYRDRLAAGAYIPIMGKHIDFYAAMLFDVPLTVSENTNAENTNTAGKKLGKDQSAYYTSFAEACNFSKDETFQHFIQKQFISGALHTVAFTGIDIPKAKRAKYDNLYQQKQDGLLSPYLYHIDPICVIDWQYNKDCPNQLDWIKLFYELPYQPNPLVKPMTQYEIVLWTMDGSVAKCDSYLTKPVFNIDDLEDKYEVPLQDAVITTYPKIPILPMPLHSGLAIGAKLAPLAAEHFQRRTHTNYSAYRDAIIVPTHKRANMLPGVGQSMDLSNFDANSKYMPRAKVDNNGIYQIGETEDFFIAEAQGHVLGFLQQQNEELEQVMATVVNQMATALNKQQKTHSTSAQSKQEDRHEMEVMLEAFAEVVRNHVQQIYQFIAHHRQEEVVWNIEGLRTKDYTDRQVLLQEATSLTMIDIPSPTFQSAYKYKLALALVDDLSDQDKQQMRDELKDAPMNTPTDAAQQKTKTPDQKAAPTQVAESNATAQKEQPGVGDTGNKALQPGSHMQDGQHVDPMIVYNQLIKDYKPKDLAWLKSASVRGPVEVDPADISFKGEEDWAANKPGSNGTDKVEKFTEEMNDKGFSAFNPVVLAYMPHNDEKYVVIDGRHRTKAAQQAGIPVVAYIVDVGSIESDTPHMQLHSKQATAS